MNSDNIILSYSFNSSCYPYVNIFYSDIHQGNHTSNIPMNNGFWYHLAMVQIGNTLSLYINGKLAVNTIIDNPPRNIVRTKCYIGNSNWGTINSPVFADFDEIKFFDRALTLSEIANDMNLNISYVIDL